MKMRIMQDDEKKRYPKTVQDYIAVNFPQGELPTHARGDGLGFVSHHSS